MGRSRHEGGAVGYPPTMTDPTATLLQAHPDPLADLDPDLRGRCIDLLLECAMACTACADACLAEEHAGMLRRCARLDLDCADLCRAAASVLTRQTDTDPTVLRAAVEACIVACRACAEECRRHADQHRHCRICAEACDRCARACDEVMRRLATPVTGT